MEQVKFQPKCTWKVQGDGGGGAYTTHLLLSSCPDELRLYALFASVTRRVARTLQQLPRLHINKHVEVFGTSSRNLRSERLSQTDSPLSGEGVSADCVREM